VRKRRALAPLLAIVLAAAIALAYTFAAGNTPFLGLDLQGGVSVVLRPTNDVDDGAISQAIAIMRQRVDALGVAEPEITRQGDNILVQIPGVRDQDRALELVGQTAELRFRPVLQVLPAGMQIAPGDPETEGEPSDEGDQGDEGDGGDTTVPAGEGEGDGTDDTPTTEAGWGPLASGEHALGAQTTETVPDTGVEAPTDPTTPEDPAAPQELELGPENFEVAPDEMAPEGALPTLPPDVCVTGVPADQDIADQPVMLPECDGSQLTAIYQLGPTMLTGETLETARATLDQTGQWVVNPVFKSGAEGIDQFNAAAAECNAGQASCPPQADGSPGRLAIVLDGRVVSAPSINAATFSRDQIEISGSFTERSARDLATALRYGALPVELEQLQAQTVSATLGRDALNAGLWAGLIGLVLVTIYMVAFYRILGALAMAKLVVEAALIWSIISYLGENQGLALTLAGVTGLIVSIGVSVDSNVVYYEHLKSDVRHGRTIRSAADKSFVTAYRTIVAADLASLIGAAVLYWLTVGPVRGFAFYLGLATIIDLIAAYFFMRPAVAAATKSGLAARRPSWFGLPAPPITEDVPAGTPATSPAREEVVT
jgi:preprotein translocase subunit SecD